jgi:hypothetical protein
VRLLTLLFALAASTALAAPRELAPGVQMVAVQEGTVLVLTATGLPEDAPTRVPAGYWVSLIGYDRLQAAMSQHQADRMAAQARADACLAVAALHHEAPSTISASVVVAGAVTLVLLGGAAGFILARHARP